MDRILKIMDANINRACEGLRVVEEITRFLIQDIELFERLREIRHSLFSDGINDPSLLSLRNAEKDIGRSIKDPILERKDCLGVARANLRRAEEALRTLEEFSRLNDTDKSCKFKDLRFRVYGLEKEIINRLLIITHRSSLKGLYAIIDLGLFKDDYLGIVKGVIEGGASLIQLRAKGISDKRFLEAGRILRQITKEVNLPFIVNDRVDLAMVLKADGVHLGQDDLPVEVVRLILGMGKIIGRSTHSIEEATKAEREGADYIGFGPIFPTLTKADLLPVGVSMLRKVKEIVRLPVFAIGGINEENIKEVIKVGVDGVACASILSKGRETVQNLSDHFKCIRQ